jgi:hypothetical protein
VSQTFQCRLIMQTYSASAANKGGVQPPSHPPATHDQEFVRIGRRRWDNSEVSSKFDRSSTSQVCLIRSDAELFCLPSPKIKQAATSHAPTKSSRQNCSGIAQVNRQTNVNFGYLPVFLLISQYTHLSTNTTRVISTMTDKGDFKDKQFAETEVADKVVEQCELR